MDKISEEMKTEKDFIEKMESSGMKPDNSNNSNYADEERNKLQQEVIIKSKEEHKEETPVVKKTTESFTNLQPFSNSESVIKENTVVKKPQKETGVYAHTTIEESAPWDDKPK